MEIDAPVSRDVMVTTRRDGVQQNLPFFAYRDGDGPWLAMTGASGLYTITSATGRYSIAGGCPKGDTFTMYIVHTTVEEAPSETITCGRIGGVAFTGAVSGILAGRNATVQTAGGLTQILVDGTFSGSTVQGAQDFIVTERTGTNIATRMKIARNTNIYMSSVHDTDISTGSMLLSMHPVTVPSKLAGESLSISSRFSTSNGTQAFLGDFMTDKWFSVPSEAFTGNDVAVLGVRASDNAARTSRDRREYLGPTGAGAKEVVLRDLPAMPIASTSATTPYARPRVRVEANDATAYSIQFSATAARDWQIFVSPGHRGESTLIDIDVPDFSSLEGFDPNWGFLVGTQLYWTYREIESNRGWYLASERSAWGVPAIVSPGLAGAYVTGAARTGLLVP